MCDHDEEKTYRIVRKWFKNKDDEVIKTGLTLEEVKEHCSDPSTRGRTPDGNMWSDVYYEE